EHLEPVPIRELRSEQLFGVEGGRRGADRRMGQGARPLFDPRQCDRAGVRRDRNGREHAPRRARENHRRHPRRAPREARRDRARRAVPARERLHERPHPRDRRRPADLTDRTESRTSLVLMLKAPERSKRRLAARLGDAVAAEAARRLAACAVEDLAAWPGRSWLAPAAPGDLDWLGDAATGHSIVLQGEGNLGARIERVAATLRRQGLDAQIFIGIDCPELDAAYLARAAAALETHDFVLGPATDGGVVLMGARRAWPPLEPL